jgi:hypothetical protein
LAEGVAIIRGAVAATADNDVASMPAYAPSACSATTYSNAAILGAGGTTTFTAKDSAATVITCQNDDGTCA